MFVDETYADLSSLLTYLFCNTGLTLSYPLLINTHFLHEQGAKIAPPAAIANLNLAQRLTLWERAFKAGYVIPALSVVTAALLTTFALKHNQNDKTALDKRFGGDWETRKKLLLISAALTGSLMIFTAIAILPTNNKLMALRVAANNKQEIKVGQAEALLKKWTQLHNVRVVAAFSGFALAVYSFIAV